MVVECADRLRLAADGRMRPLGLRPAIDVEMRPALVARHEARAGNFANAIAPLREIIPELSLRYGSDDPRSLSAKTVLSCGLALLMFFLLLGGLIFGYVYFVKLGK